PSSPPHSWFRSSAHSPMCRHRSPTLGPYTTLFRSGIGDPAILAPKLPAGQIPRAFQLPEGLANRLHAFLANGGQAPRGVIPLIRQGEHHGEKPLGLQGQGGIFQVVVAHRSEEHASELQSSVHLVCRRRSE